METWNGRTGVHLSLFQQGIITAFPCDVYGTRDSAYELPPMTVLHYLNSVGQVMVQIFPQGLCILFGKNGDLSIVQQPETAQ